jgi:arylsulfatase A-like enzyme
MRTLTLLFLLIATTATPAADPPPKPNIILILCDDLGYGDLPAYGNTKLKTPNLDRLAKEGVRFTDFYAAGTQCTPSRAGLLTGRYPARFGLTYSLMGDADTGLPASEITLPQLLRPLGYATMLAGKWHLGGRPESRPTRRGFDHFSGLLRGHDTDPREYWTDDHITDRNADPTTLATRYTEAAVAFIKSQAEKKQPFFLMLAHTAPHTPLAPSPAFKGRSAAGLYGDCVEEIDHSLGQLLAALEQGGQGGAAANTLVFFSSDNGPFIGPDGGSPGPLRAGKFTTFEGGIRVPAIFWMPARIKPRAEKSPAILLDLFPTCLALAGGKPPTDRAIDGIDLTPTLVDNQPRDNRELFFYAQDKLESHRSGPWKLKVPNPPANPPGPPMLFDLSKDPAEQTDLAPTHPDLVQKLRTRMLETDKSLKSH